MWVWVCVCMCARTCKEGDSFFFSFLVGGRGKGGEHEGDKRESTEKVKAQTKGIEGSGVVGLAYECA